MDDKAFYRSLNALALANELSRCVAQYNVAARLKDRDALALVNGRMALIRAELKRR